MKPLYLLALLPPEPVFSQTWALKQEVHRLTGSHNAVRLPPHITLLPPFRQSEALEAKATAALTAFATTQAAPTVGLDGFAWFGDRTLFVRVSDATALCSLQAALTRWCANHLPEMPREARPFTPHLTLATRDLSVAQVPVLRKLFAHRLYTASFVARQLTLFRHDGQRWRPRVQVELALSPPCGPPAHDAKTG